MKGCPNCAFTREGSCPRYWEFKNKSYGPWTVSKSYRCWVPYGTVWVELEKVL
jgi:hypothetical protein